MSTPESQSEIVTTTLGIQDAVRDRLTFVKYADVDDALESGEADCMGYSYLGSVALEDVGIDHRIAFINEHAALLIPDDEITWFWHMDAPRLTQALPQTTLLTSTDSRAISTVSSKKLILGASSDYQTTVGYSWITPDNAGGTAKAQNPDTADALLLLTTFAPQLGRQALYHFARFQKTYESGDIKKAAESVIILGENFPEIDLRNPVGTRVTSVVKRLSIKGEFETAHAVTDAYFSSLKWSKDSRTIEYYADCLRHIAKYSDQPTLARRAIELYTQASKLPRSFKGSIITKIEKCNQQLATKQGTQ